MGKPPFAMQARIAFAVAFCSVKSRPVPDAPFSGHHALTVTGPAFAGRARACPGKVKAAKIPSATIRFMPVSLHGEEGSVGIRSRGRQVLRAGLSTLLMVLASCAKAGDDISIDVSTLKDVVSFCIRADADHKISAQYGVEFRGEAPKLWSETFPKIITGEGVYFQTPLRVDLRYRGDVSGTTMHIQLGACTKSISKCDLLNFHLRIPSHQQPTSCS